MLIPTPRPDVMSCGPSKFAKPNPCLGIAFRIRALRRGNVGTTKDYQRYAVRCLQEARTTTDSQHKSFLVEMAQAWRRLAEHATADSNQVDNPDTEEDRGD
jgi:hypothetical protein